MKRLSLIIGLLLAVVAGNAQNAVTPTNAQKAHTQALRMQKLCTLSSDQVAKCEAVIVAKLDAADAVTNNTTMSAPDKQTAIEKLQVERDQEIAGILTAEQYALYTHKRAEAKARTENTGH